MKNPKTIIYIEVFLYKVSWVINDPTHLKVKLMVIKTTLREKMTFILNIIKLTYSTKSSFQLMISINHPVSILSGKNPNLNCAIADLLEGDSLIVFNIIFNIYGFCK